MSTPTEVPTITLKTIADLKAYDNSDPSSAEAIEVLGYHEEGDGGGGLYYWNPNPLVQINSINVYPPNSPIDIAVDPILTDISSGDVIFFENGANFEVKAPFTKGATSINGFLNSHSVIDNESSLNTKEFPLAEINNLGGYAINAQISMQVQPLAKALMVDEVLNFENGGKFTLSSSASKGDTWIHGELEDHAVSNNEKTNERTRLSTVTINNSNGYSPFSITIDPIPESLSSGSTLDFTGGGTFELTANANKGATTLIGNLTEQSVLNDEKAFLSDNGGTIIEPNNTNTGRWIFAHDAMVNQLTFGAKCAKDEDDTVFIQSYFDFLALSKIKSASFAPVDFIEMKSISLISPLEIDLNGCTFIGNEENEFFNIQSNNITLFNGFFGENEGLDKKRLATFSFWDTPNLYGKHSGLAIHNITYTGKKKYPAIFISAGSSNIQISNSNFIQKNTDYEDVSSLESKTAIYIAGGDVSGFEFDINLTINNCYFEGWFDAWSGNGKGYSRNSIFTGNKVFNCQRGLHNYHCRNSVITNNIFDGSIYPIEIWRSHQTSDNYFINSKSSSHTIRIEAINGLFSNNVIKNSLGSGLLLDGGGSIGMVSDNFINNCGRSGIIMDGNFQFGGQFKSTVIQDNKVYNCGEHGIFGGDYDGDGGDSQFRDVEIEGNYIAGVANTDIRLATTNITINGENPSVNGSIKFIFDGTTVTVYFEVGDTKKAIGKKAMIAINDSDLPIFCFFEETTSDLIFSGKGLNNEVLTITATGISLSTSSATFLAPNNQEYSGILISIGTTGRIGNLYLNDNLIKGNVADQINTSDIQYGIYLQDGDTGNSTSFNAQNNQLIAPVPFKCENTNLDCSKIFIRNTVLDFTNVSISENGDIVVTENLDLTTHHIQIQSQVSNFTLKISDATSGNQGNVVEPGPGSFSKYTKNGSLVTVIITIKNVVTTSLIQGNTVRLFGLPFNPIEETYITVFPVSGLAIPGDIIFGEIPTGGNMSLKTRGSVSRDIKVSDITSGANEINFNFSYFTSD
ncbi:MAG: hypothetical protein BalsKO_00560 [Balneolaceae bacterium]